jgi:ferredoxin
MTHVITGKCLGEQYGSCVAVCPVDCIHPGEHKGEPFMIIDPENCIDCGVCIPECPIDAIVSMPDKDPEYTKINAELAPTFVKNPPITPRPSNDPPRKSGNKLVN